jgi:hypothetical protein
MHMKSMRGAVPGKNHNVKFLGFRKRQPKYNEPLQLQPLKTAILRDFGSRMVRREGWELRELRRGLGAMPRMKLVALCAG